jgi:hypothetical protein
MVDRMHTRSHAWIICLITLLLLMAPARVGAHIGEGGPIQTFTQSVGPYGIIATLQIPEGAPGPLIVTLAPEQLTEAATVEVRAMRRGRTESGAPPVQVALTPGAAAAPVQLTIAENGEWELELRAGGASGEGIARLPFAVVAPQPAPYTLPLIIALGVLGITLLAGVGVAATRRGAAAPAGLQQSIGALQIAALTAAAIFGWLQAADQNAPRATVTVDTYGRPHANLILSSEPAEPVAGRPLTLTIALSDGVTGLPVDDLEAHHEALMHLALIDDAGQAFAHLHPARIAPGIFRMTFTPERAGDYTAYAEITRHGGGTQLPRGQLVIDGAAAPILPPGGPGMRTIDELAIDVAAAGALRAGRQSVITLTVRDADGPVSDIAPWLGMAGHMMARSDDGVIFAHIHASGPPAPSGTPEAAQRYGPEITFAYTFPQAGRYQCWAQFQRAGAIVTVPFTIDIAE